jgi:hypothetical protein
MKEYKIKITFFFFDKKNRKIFYPLNGYPLIGYRCYNTYGWLKDKKEEVFKEPKLIKFL